MKLKRLSPVVLAGVLTIPAWWHPASATVTQCSDNIDNDGDGGIDFRGHHPDPNNPLVHDSPADPDCTSFLDDSEFGPTTTPTNNTSNSSSSATNNNTNTSNNTNSNTSNSTSNSSSTGTSSSNSSSCGVGCNLDLL